LIAGPAVPKEPRRRCPRHRGRRGCSTPRAPVGTCQGRARPPRRAGAPSRDRSGVQQYLLRTSRASRGAQPAGAGRPRRASRGVRPPRLGSGSAGRVGF
jgi:hypothetical protein